MPIQLPLNEECYKSLDVLCLSGRSQQMRWNHVIKQVHAHQFWSTFQHYSDSKQWNKVAFWAFLMMTTSLPWVWVSGVSPACSKQRTPTSHKHKVCAHTCAYAWTHTHTHSYTHPPTDLGPIGIRLCQSLGQRAGQQLETLVSSWYYHQLVLKRQEHQSHNISNVLK